MLNEINERLAEFILNMNEWSWITVIVLILMAAFTIYQLGIGTKEERKTFYEEKRLNRTMENYLNQKLNRNG